MTRTLLACMIALLTSGICFAQAPDAFGPAPTPAATSTVTPKHHTAKHHTTKKAHTKKHKATAKHKHQHAKAKAHAHHAKAHAKHHGAKA